MSPSGARAAPGPTLSLRNDAAGHVQLMPSSIHKDALCSRLQTVAEVVDGALHRPHVVEIDHVVDDQFPERILKRDLVVSGELIRLILSPTRQLKAKLRMQSVALSLVHCVSRIHLYSLALRLPRQRSPPVSVQLLDLRLGLRRAPALSSLWRQCSLLVAARPGRRCDAPRLNDGIPGRALCRKTATFSSVSWAGDPHNRGPSRTL